MGKSEKEELDKATFASFTYTGNALHSRPDSTVGPELDSIQFKR